MLNISRSNVFGKVVLIVSGGESNHNFCGQTVNGSPKMTTARFFIHNCGYPIACYAPVYLC